MIKPKNINSALILACLLACEISIPIGYTAALPGITAVAQAQTDLKAEADRLLEQGQQQFRDEQYVLAAESWEQALTIYLEIGDQENQERVSSKLMSIYLRLEAYDKIPALVRRAGSKLTIGPGIEVTVDPSISSEEFEALGPLMRRGVSDQNSNTIPALEQFLARTRAEGNREQEVKILWGLGWEYAKQNNYPQAITYAEQVLNAIQETEDSQLKFGALSLLAYAYYQDENYNQTITYSKKILALARQIRNRSNETMALQFLGLASLALGNHEQAIVYAQESLRKAEKDGNQYAKGGALTMIGEALFQSNQLAEAETSLYQGIKLLESVRLEETSTTHAGNFQEFFEQIRSFEFQAFATVTLQKVLIASNKVEKALEISEWGRARIFAELLAKRLSTPRTQGTAAPTPEQILQQMATRMAQVYPGISQEQILRRLEQQYRDNPQSLEQLEEYPEFFDVTTTLTSNQIQQPVVDPPTIEEIKAIAQQQQATLIQYSLISDFTSVNIFPGQGQSQAQQLYIWVISPTGEVKFRSVPLDFVNLAHLVKNSRESMGVRGYGPDLGSERNSNWKKDLQQLHQILIEPIEDLLPDNPNEQVIFIPHQSLFIVSFPALQAVNGQYLLERHTIRSVPSIQTLSSTYQQRQKLEKQDLTRLQDNQSLVIGNPTMPSLGEPPEQLSNLPGTEEEATNIARLLNTQALIGNQATRSTVLQRMPQARVIHLATHGVLDDIKDFGIPGAIALAPSGGDNGWLTTSEILDLSLQAELVVLSACDTGRGSITGDGVVGLSRSFIAAGVPSVVVSLWKVPDDATSFLMKEFYNNLKIQPNKAQALRQAMLATKEKYPAPVNWAAFTLVGESE